MAQSLIEGYKKMVLLRTAQQELVNLYLKNRIMSIVHFYVGQEAIAAGVCASLNPQDKVLGNHRSHGHYLAKGGNLKAMICELLGRANGSAKGKGGSMHMIDKAVNFIGSSPILGSVVPIACGVAFEQRYNKKDGIAVAFYGDGASEEGVVYETYNLAALLKVPLLLVLENNLFAINSPQKDRRSKEYNLAKITEGFGVKYLKADGNDYVDVAEKSQELTDFIRSTGNPAVLECVAYRHMAHSTPLNDEGYREEDTADERAEKDSVPRLRKLLISQQVSEGDLNKIEEEINSEVLEAIEFALNSPYPAKEELYTNIYG